MSPYLHPDRVDEKRVARWLEANGCRHYVALEPVIVRGNYADYTAVCRKDPKSVARIPFVNGEPVLAGRKRLRIRIPFKEVR